MLGSNPSAPEAAASPPPVTGWGALLTNHNQPKSHEPTLQKNTANSKTLPFRTPSATDRRPEIGYRVDVRF